MRRGATYYVRQPGGELMTIEVPADDSEETKIRLTDGTEAVLTEDYRAVGTQTPDEQWILTATKTDDSTALPLAGAVIGLYAEEACQTFLRSETSGPDGTLSFSGLVRGQTYWLKEMAAPAGYHLNSAAFPAEESAPSVSIPNTPRATATDPGESENPGEAENPDNPNDPGNPENPGTPDDPDRPDNPGTPGDPSTPETPGNPDNPGRPETPGNPDNPVSPDNPGTPGNPDTPNDPGQTDDPGSPAKPVPPENPGSSGNPGGPEKNENPGTTGSPQTGDSTPQTAAVVLLSGALLTLLILYLVLRSRA